MKRINLSVDLEENSIFEKEVEKAIRDKVKQIVRETYQEEIKKIAYDELIRLLSQGSGNPYSKQLESSVKSMMIPTVREVLNEININALVVEKTKEIIETKINWATSEIDKKVKTSIENAINKATEEKIKILLQI